MFNTLIKSEIFVRAYLTGITRIWFSSRTWTPASNRQQLRLSL